MQAKLIPVLEIGDYPYTFAAYPGTRNLYPLHFVADEDLLRLLRQHLDYWLSHPDDAEILPLYGGYVLQIDGEDTYYPQCCGSLSDIFYFQDAVSRCQPYTEAHPVPDVRWQGDIVCFDLTMQEYEQFNPPPRQPVVTVKMGALELAVINAKVILEGFITRLERLNIAAGFNIENIGGLLVWGRNGTSEWVPHTPA